MEKVFTGEKGIVKVECRSSSRVGGSLLWEVGFR